MQEHAISTEKKVEVPDKSSKLDLDNGNQYVKVVVHVPGI